jgi:DNA-binding NarL/FixJ family response regulator
MDLDRLPEVEHALRERVKELECVYRISAIREAHFANPEVFLQGVVDCLPSSWQWPEHCAARIVYGTLAFVTTNFREGPWRLIADVSVAGVAVGRVEVFYAADAPVAPGADAFLDEERALLRVVAERVSSALSHMRTDMELRDAHEVLQRQNQALQETNIALKTVLSRLEEEKREIRGAVAGSIEKIVMPIVMELELATTGRQRAYVSLLRQCLNEVGGPLHAGPTPWHVELSPAEVAIGTMIRNGLSTKEIAQLRCISAGTVRRHRENIRKKLGLQNRQANLKTYLANVPSA